MKACDFHLPHNAIWFPQKFLYKLCFQFIEGQVSETEKFRANCVDDIFFWGLFIIYKTSGWKVNETRLYDLFQGKFPGATEHLKRLSFFSFYWTKCSKRKFVFHY